ncbi:MAG: hypothetical protein ACRD1K_15900 [Acidimicrobiales bacterium]
MNPLDRRETTLATRAAMVAGAAFIALYATTGFSDAAYVVGAAIGVGLAALLGLAARSGRRMLTGLAALAVGLGPWGSAWVFGAPFLLLGGWVLFRAKPRTRAAAPDSDSADRPDRPEPADSSVPAADRRGRPTANKRYTPPSAR